MTTTRVPAGVPTGGQFAASAHAESGVTLTTPAPSARDQAFAAIEKMRARLDRLDTLAVLTGVRDDARAQHGDRVAHIAVEEMPDDAGEDMVVYHGYTADGVNLGTVAASDGLRTDLPDGLHTANRHEKGFSTHYSAVIDMAALDRVDIAAETKQAEMSAAHDALARHTPGGHFVVDQALIDTQIDEETNFGSFDQWLDDDENVTPDERRQIAEEFNGAAIDFESVQNDFHIETERATRTVLARTRGLR